MRSGVLFCFILFFFSLVSSASCYDNQTIMRLYSSSNSHVSAWNESVSDYVYEICYDDIFGVDYVGSDVHSCSGTNRVLSLYDSSNSHASEVTDINYNYEVCYGNLSCIYDDSVVDSCGNGGEIVAKMYSSSNSHVSDVSDANYPIKICCVDSVVVMDVYWADANGNKITEADFGDTVKLIAKGVDGGTFRIREEDTSRIFDDFIRHVVGESVGSDLVGVWTIKSEDMDKTAKDDYDKFYFSINGVESDYLAIDKHGKNDPMAISIVSPVCGDYYDEGDSFNIVVKAGDFDDVLVGTVNVDGQLVGEFSNGGVSLIETFDSIGTAQVVVDGWNSRGEKKRLISNVMVLDMEGASYVDGDYVAACIDKPEDASNIPGSVVEFDASTTRGIRIVDGVIDELVPGEDVFSWYWTFYPEKITRNFINSEDSFAYDFTAQFSVAGRNSALLKVEV